MEVSPTNILAEIQIAAVQMRQDQDHLRQNNTSRSLHPPAVLTRIWHVPGLIQKITSSLCLCLVCFVATAQRIDHSSTNRNINSDKYFRFHYDNDFFTATDRYYTQGITLEYIHPSIKRFLPAKLLWKPFASPAQYGISLNLFAYTPTSILSDVILYGDRPFDANISLETFLVQADPIREQQVVTAFSIGVMGPLALGNEIQTGIHRWTKNPIPRGWEYQIKNDLIINYRLGYEKKLLRAGDHFLANATAELRVGTLDNKLSGGLNFMGGKFNKRFQATGSDKKKAEFYLFGQGRLHLAGYDASLQGGVFNRKSPYTIPARDLSRISFQGDAGIIVNFKKFYFSYTQSFLTKEFQTGKTHRWGGLSMGCAF